MRDRGGPLGRRPHGPKGPTRAWPMRAQEGPRGPGPSGPRGAHQGLACEGPWHLRQRVSAAQRVALCTYVYAYIYICLYMSEVLE